MRLELSKCIVRSLEAADARFLVKHANNPAVWANLLDIFPHPYTRDDAEKWLSKVTEQIPPTDFAIAAKDELIGVIGFQRLSGKQIHSAEIGYWIGQDYWGRGIATEAVRAITKYVLLRHADVRRIYARVFAWNIASMRVLEKCGYHRERWLLHSVVKNGKLVDEALYTFAPSSIVPLQ